nr:reverse transcriptase domain-containing protein [Tanacetum cinerariifolium]
MIPEPGDANREVTVTETFHVQTDDELNEKELKQIEADDQAIQTILLGLPEDIYAVVDSCETAQEIWLRVQQMMKGSDIGIQEKKAKNKHFPEKIAINLKFLNNLQPEWSRHVTIVHQTKDLHTGDYTQLYDFLKYSQKEMVGGNGENQFRQYAWQNAGNPTRYNDVIGNQVIQNAVQNPRVHNVGNQNGLIADQDEIEEVNANCILMVNLQQASTSGTQIDNAPVYDSDGSAEVRNSRNKSVVSQVKSSYANSNSSSETAKLTHAVNQQTSDVTTAMTAILKQFQAIPPPGFVKVVEEIYVTCGGAHPYYQCLAADGNTFLELRDNIQGYVAAVVVNYNQGNSGYRPMGVVDQIRPPGFAQPNVQNNQNRFSQPQGYNRGNNFNQDQSYQTSTQQNQVVLLSELEKVKRMNEANMKAMQTQINNVKRSGSLPSNTISNPKGELKAINTRSGIILVGPFVSIPPPFINPEEDERVEETLTDHISLSIPSRSHLLLSKNPSLLLKETLFCIKGILFTLISLINQGSLLSNKEKLLELANTPLNENCSAVILKKLPKKLGDPEKFLIPCGFSELRCKAPSDLGASINLMPLSVWKKLGLPEIISTRMTLELANRAICTPTGTGIARDVFVSVGKFTFPADFVIVDYESDPRVPLILGRPFLRTAHALIGIHGEEMILRGGDERLTLNMRHDTSSYSNQP